MKNIAKGKKHLQIILGRRATINTRELPAEVVNSIKKALNIPNPIYAKLKKLGYWTGKTPPYIKLWRTSKEWMIMPRGFIEVLLKTLKQFQISYVLVDYRCSGEKVDFVSKINLRKYQQKAVQLALQKEQGVIEAPCGAGKTVIGLEIVARASRNAIWLVHTKELAQQAGERARDFLNLNTGELGYIGGGSFEIGSKLTIAMVQTLVRRKLSSKLLGLFGTLIVDEAHHTPAYTFTKVIDQFPAIYRIGLTATPQRSDGLSSIMYYTLGNTISRISPIELTQEDNLITPRINAVATNFYYPYQDDYARMLSKLVKDRKRNLLIINKIKEEALKGNFSLVLSERVEHCYELYNMLKQEASEIKSVVFTGQIPLKQRERIAKQIVMGEYNVIFATSPLAEEGLDWKIINRLFLTCPTRSKRKTQQAIGRIQRPYPGKIDAVVYDFVDVNLPVLKAQFKARYYKSYLPLLHGDL